MAAKNVTVIPATINSGSYQPTMIMNKRKVAGYEDFLYEKLQAYGINKDSYVCAMNSDENERWSRVRYNIRGPLSK